MRTSPFAPSRWSAKGIAVTLDESIERGEEVMVVALIHRRYRRDAPEP